MNRSRALEAVYRSLEDCYRLTCRFVDLVKPLCGCILRPTEHLSSPVFSPTTGANHGDDLAPPSGHISLILGA